ncbi:MAG: hypothetical protein FJ276_12885 [Planctomycetes bacterium]|nr:hypothetical protein [Planctomycetota bacterium]
MSEQSEFLARVLRTGARTFAAYAATELLRTSSEHDASRGGEAFAVWQQWLCVRVEELSAALAAEQPSLFKTQVQWARDCASARGVSSDHVRAGLLALRDVLQTELPAPVRPLADRYLEVAFEVFDTEPAGLSSGLSADSRYGRLASSYLLAIFEGDRRRASRLLLDAVDKPETVRALYARVLLPAQAELGRMWLAGEINVAEEHFASQTTKMVMGQLLARAAIMPPNGKTMLAAAVTGNWHDIGLCALADVFEMAGWRSIQLGADVPAADVVQAVEFFDADLLALSATLHVQIQTVKATIQAVRSGPRGDVVKILVGGLAFNGTPHLATGIGADGHAYDLDEAERLAARLVGLTT